MNRTHVIDRRNLPPELRSTDAMMRQLAAEDGHDARNLYGPGKPIDGHRDSPRSLPCWPRPYEDMTPTDTDEHPNRGTLLGVIVVAGFLAAMVAGVAAIVREGGVM